MKTKFILHGGFTSVRNKWNDSFYEELTKGIREGATALLVYFSRDEEEWNDLFEQDRERILRHTNLQNLNIVLAQKENFIKQARNADVLYFRGGGSAQLIDTIKGCPAFSEVIRGKVIAGSSAGVYLFSKYYFSNSQEDIFEGLGILPIKALCHYQSKIFTTDKDPIALLSEYPNEYELVVIKDHEWITREIDL